VRERLLEEEEEEEEEEEATRGLTPRGRIVLGELWI
jgi:hypothetical protein